MSEIQDLNMELKIAQLEKVEPTLRDQFAMAALNGLIVNPKDYSDVEDNDSAALRAYQIADAMLKARIPEPENE